MDLQENLITLKIIWIPSHIGIKNNETVDHLAKTAAIIGIPREYKIPISDITAESRYKLKNEWDSIWNDKVATKGTTLTFYKLKSGPPWFKNIETSRSIITTITRIRIGHCSTNKHLNRIGIINTPLCTTCQQEDTPDHIFFQCSKTTQSSREEFIQELRKNNITPPFCLQKILKNINMSIFPALTKFIIANDIKL